MLDHSDYIPILRWKMGEQRALDELHEQEKRHITPLIELVPSDFTDERVRKSGGLDGKLKKTAERIGEVWGRSPFFIDLLHLAAKTCDAGDRGHALTLLGSHARSLGIQMIPVTGVDRDPDYQSAIAGLVRVENTEACVRLDPRVIGQGGLSEELRQLLAKLDLSPSRVHLLVDLGFIAESGTDLACVLALLPDLSHWRTVTVASGAFPRDLSDFEIGEHEVKRADWLAWRNQVVAPVRRLPRMPTYGDYGTRHANYEEPPSGARVSASIRYTADEYWVIMRGEWVNKPGGPGFGQYPANALMLRERPEFRGAEFSAGDRYIAGMRLHSPNTGNATTWVQACTNHHLTFVVRQIAELF